MKKRLDPGNQFDTSNKLLDCIGRVFIIAYKESTELLEKFLIEEGFNCTVLRQEDREEFKNLSPSYLCMMNHKQAWEKAMQSEKPSIIVEADFVPVLKFGKLPLPFAANQNDVGICWLYNCAAQVYSVSDLGYAEGFSTSMVAYIITPQSASFLIDLAKEVIEKIGDKTYSTWDSNVDSFLRARKMKNFIPFRNYGEHGGLPNLEHFQNGLSKTHRADVFYGKLAFMPLYASHINKDKIKFFYIRFYARLKGIARLLTGRFLRLQVIKGSSVPVRLVSFAIRRYLSISL